MLQDQTPQLAEAKSLLECGKESVHACGVYSKGVVGRITRRCCHMAAVRLGCKGALVGTGWANSHPGCMNGVIKHYLHHVGGSFLAGKVAWVLYLCFLAENADYCMFVN